MEGTVKTVNWTNPHISFVVETDAKDGEAVKIWVFEVSSPGVLTRSGWTKRSLQPGDHVQIRRANEQIQLLMDPSRTFYQVLQNKLKWGGS